MLNLRSARLLERPNLRCTMGTVMDVEVEYGAPGVFPLSMGIGREDGHEREGLQTWKGAKAAYRC